MGAMNFEKPMEQAFRYCPRCGTPGEGCGEIPFRCDQCGFAFFFGPVTAVGGILWNDQGEVLLIRRARNPGAGLFGMPGGFVDQNETAQEALRRETTEEVGLVIETMEFLTTLPNRYTYEGLTTAVLDIFFTCYVPSFDGVQIHPDEVSGTWIGTPSAEQWDQMAFHSNRMALIEFMRKRKSSR